MELLEAPPPTWTRISMITSEVNAAGRAERIVWRRCFDEQLTTAALLKVRRFAEARGRPLIHAGLLDKHSAAGELMNDAIAATLAGTATWDPERKALDAHLIDVIQWQTRNARRRHGRVRHASFDDSRDDSSSDGHRLVNEVSLLRSAAAPSTSELCEAAGRVLEEVRALAGGDTDVVRIVDTIQAGETEHGALIKATGLRAAKFRNARRRLGRIVARLPATTHSAVRAVLE